MRVHKAALGHVVFETVGGAVSGSGAVWLEVSYGRERPVPTPSSLKSSSAQEAPCPVKVRADLW